jgi:predicted membrane channel-forming protein YqfA (hemolysin III family)
MQKLVIVTYVLRGLGFILVLLSLFGHEIILNLFPGLEGKSINPIFYSGIVVYLIGAVIYFFINKKEKADRRRREIEESYKKAGLDESDDESDDESGDDSDDSSNSVNENSSEK